MSASSSTTSKKKKLLIVAPLDLQISGNNTTVARLGKMLKSSKFHVDVKSCCISSSSIASSSSEQKPETMTYDCVIGLHALRCAKWLINTEGKYLTKKYLSKSSSSSSSNQGNNNNFDKKPSKNPHFACHDNAGLSDTDEEDPQQVLAKNMMSLNSLIESAPPPPPNSTCKSSDSSPSSPSSSSLLCPFILIFGGTDVNEFSKDPTKVAMMKIAVDRASKCVCFSPALREKALDVFKAPKINSNKLDESGENVDSSDAKWSKKFIVIPQTVDDEIWNYCRKLLRFDHFDTRPDAESPSEIDQVLYEAQKLQFEREERLRKENSNVTTTTTNSKSVGEKLDDKKHLLFDREKNGFPVIRHRNYMMDRKPPHTLEVVGWRHSEWLNGNSAKRWIVMPAGIRKVKNQLAVLEMIVELNKLAMKREIDEIARKAELSSKNNHRNEKVPSLNEVVVSSTDNHEKIDSSLSQTQVDESALAAQKENDNNQPTPLAEWGVLLLGPEIEKEYAELIEIATSWYLDKHQANTIVIWHREGISPQRLCTLLFDKCNKVSLVMNTSFSEGQPQAIMEAMVVTAVQRQQEEMMKSEFDDNNDHEEETPAATTTYSSTPTDNDGFLCAVSDCPGNLAVADDSCGIVLPLSEHPRLWAKKVDAEFFCDKTSNDGVIRARKRDEAAKRAKENMQSIQEMMAWNELVESVV